MHKRANDVASGDESVCMSVDQMIDYVKNRLPDKQRQQLETHLNECRLCSEAVEGVRLYPDKEELREITGSAKRFSSLHSPWVNFLSKNWHGAYAVAAAFFIGLTALVYLNVKEKPHEAAFAEYFAPYPSAIPLVRSRQPQNKLEAAFDKYAAKNYAAALPLFQELLTADPRRTTFIRFYMGISYLGTDEPETAISIFQKEIDDSTGQFHDPAEWFLALAFLKANDAEKCKSILERIVLRPGIYQARATSLLKRLE